MKDRSFRGAREEAVKYWHLDPKNQINAFPSHLIRLEPIQPVKGSGSHQAIARRAPLLALSKNDVSTKCPGRDGKGCPKEAFLEPHRSYPANSVWLCENCWAHDWVLHSFRNTDDQLTCRVGVHYSDLERATVLQIIEDAIFGPSGTMTVSNRFPNVAELNELLAQKMKLTIECPRCKIGDSAVELTFSPDASVFDIEGVTAPVSDATRKRIQALRPQRKTVLMGIRDFFANLLAQE